MTIKPLRFRSSGRFRAGILLIAVGGGASSYCSIYDESLLAGSGGVVGSGGAPSATGGGLPNTGGSATGGAAGAAIGGSAGVSPDATSTGGSAAGGAAGAAMDGSAGIASGGAAAMGGSAGIASGGAAGTSTDGSGGEAPCGTNQKRCNGACVERTPLNGCNGTACTACPGPAPAYGSLTCNPMGECAFDCLPGYVISGNGCVSSTDAGGDGGMGDGGSVRCGSTNCVPCSPPHITCCERTTGNACLCAPPDYASTLCR
jgi:hypothetical protein